MADDATSVQMVPRPRRWGVSESDAILTLGRDVEYRFPLQHAMTRMLTTIVRHWEDGDPLVRLYRRLYPYRDDLRRHPHGQFAGSWHGPKIDLHVTPRYDPDDEDWAPTNNALPAIRPRPIKPPKALPDRTNFPEAKTGT